MKAFQNEILTRLTVNVVTSERELCHELRSYFARWARLPIRWKWLRELTAWVVYNPMRVNWALASLEESHHIRHTKYGYVLVSNDAVDANPETAPTPPGQPSEPPVLPERLLAHAA